MQENFKFQHQPAIVVCACGHTFETQSLYQVISTEICSQCHPFKQKDRQLIQKGNRVSKFQAKYKQGDTRVG